MSEILDNREHRIRMLKEIIRKLHAGEAPEALKRQFGQILSQVGVGEISAMEQQLMEEGMAVKEVQRLCDVHASLMKDGLDRQAPRAVPPGHPVDVFRRENEALVAQTARVRGALAGLGSAPDAAAATAVLREARALVGELMDVDKHYRRKEYLVFPFLEKAGITGPSKVMWGKDDEVRAGLKSLLAALEAAEGQAPASTRLVVSAVAEPALSAVPDMVFKENRILWPMCLDTLTEEDWSQVHRQSPEIGWCLVVPEGEWTPSEAAPVTDPVALPANGNVLFPSGAIPAAVLPHLLNTMPFDVTFVDAEDRVRYFTEGRERVFDRNRAILGRLVHHCHPPASVHVVDRILADFRSGAEDVAEFWIQMRGKFLHIRYFAIRDGAGTYLGTLEVTQDATAIRALEGERRILSYEPAV